VPPIDLALINPRSGMPLLEVGDRALDGRARAEHVINDDYLLSVRH